MRVPKGMVEAACDAYNFELEYRENVRKSLKAALLWQQDDFRPKLDALLEGYLGKDSEYVAGIRDNILKLLGGL